MKRFISFPLAVVGIGYTVQVSRALSAQNLLLGLPVLVEVECEDVVLVQRRLRAPMLVIRRVNSASGECSVYRRDVGRLRVPG